MKRIRILILLAIASIGTGANTQMHAAAMTDEQVAHMLQQEEDAAFARQLAGDQAPPHERTTKTTTTASSAEVVDFGEQETLQHATYGTIYKLPAGLRHLVKNFVCLQSEQQGPNQCGLFSAMNALAMQILEYPAWMNSKEVKKAVRIIQERYTFRCQDFLDDQQVKNYALGIGDDALPMPLNNFYILGNDYGLHSSGRHLINIASSFEDDNNQVDQLAVFGDREFIQTQTSFDVLKAFLNLEVPIVNLQAQIAANGFGRIHFFCNVGGGHWILLSVYKASNSDFVILGLDSINATLFGVGELDHARMGDYADYIYRELMRATAEGRLS